MHERWQPSTKGEELLFLLRRSFRDEKALSAQAFRPNIEYSRVDSLASFFSMAFVLNIFARTLRLGQKIVDEYSNESDDVLLRELIYEIENRLDISPAELHDGAIDRIAVATRAAVESSGRNISNSVRKQLGDEYTRPDCYICGTRLGWRKSSNLPLVSVDHIWPSAWGGDSVPDNLLPACESCNTSRNDLLGWQWASVHTVVGPQDPGSYLRVLSNSIKSSLHLRAIVSYASSTRTTLKDAALAVGPRLSEPLKIDSRDTTDFFNLIGHDEKKYPPHWSRT